MVYYVAAANIVSYFTCSAADFRPHLASYATIKSDYTTKVTSNALCQAPLIKLKLRWKLVNSSYELNKANSRIVAQIWTNLTQGWLKKRSF